MLRGGHSGLMSLRAVRPVSEATLALMSTDRLHAYRRRLLGLQQSPDLEDITDDELEQARNPDFVFFKNDPMWPALMRLVLQALRRRQSVTQ